MTDRILTQSSYQKFIRLRHTSRFGLYHYLEKNALIVNHTHLSMSIMGERDYHVSYLRGYNYRKSPCTKIGLAIFIYYPTFELSYVDIQLFACSFFCVDMFFFRNKLFQKFFQKHCHSVKQFGSRSGSSIGPNLGPNCLLYQQTKKVDATGKELSEHVVFLYLEVIKLFSCSTQLRNFNCS